MSNKCNVCDEPLSEQNQKECIKCKRTCRECDKTFGSESDLIQAWDGARYCRECAVECDSGSDCQGDRYFEPTLKLSKRGLCESCEEVAPPSDGQTCEYHPDRPATAHVDGTPVCDDCHDDAYPID